MERIEKTLFICYRRTNIAWALAIFQNLTQHGYDVFFDYNGIASGDFERVILGNITSRAHFLVLLTPSALERCGDQADWFQLLPPIVPGHSSFAFPASGSLRPTNFPSGEIAVIQL